MSFLSNSISAVGYCKKCDATHSLQEGNSRKHAIELMKQLETTKNLHPDGLAKYSTDILFGDTRGQMFGIAKCSNAKNETVILKAFSGQYNGHWLIDGWVPPIIDPKKLQTLSAETEKQIKDISRVLNKTKKDDLKYKQFFKKRKLLSQQLMKKVHSLYFLTNFCGETRGLTDVFIGENIPTGAGDCCAPKLLNYAALNGLTPLGISEFYFGAESKSGNRKHKEFYSACQEKCQPILGFMLCGLNSSASVKKTPLGIIYCDEEIVIVNKPSGLLAVPGKEIKDCVVSHIKKIFPDCPEQPAVHLLDMDTSGLMVLARTKEAHRELSRQFHDRETKKRYIALLDGKLREAKGTIKLPFRLDIDNRPKQIYDPLHGKMGITHWKKLGTEDNKTRVEFIPITGRTHQLRVHAASPHGLGIPIIGDRLYGSATKPGQLKLHASLLEFHHPTTGKKIRFKSRPLF